jgi:hypothetical protein
MSKCKRIRARQSTNRRKHAIKPSCKKQLTIIKTYASRSWNIKNTHTHKKKKKKKKSKSFQKLVVLWITRKEGEKDVQGKRGKKNRIIRKVFIPCMTKIQTIEISTSLGIGCLLDSSR